MPSALCHSTAVCCSGSRALYLASVHNLVMIILLYCRSLFAHVLVHQHFVFVSFQLRFLHFSPARRDLIAAQCYCFVLFAIVLIIFRFSRLPLLGFAFALFPLRSAVLVLYLSVRRFFAALLSFAFRTNTKPHLFILTTMESRLNRECS